MAENWDVLNEQGRPTGKQHTRGVAMPDGAYYLVVHVWIVNQKGEILLSQRTADRETYPLAWEVTGGSVLAGETSFQGALREVREELGLSLDPTLGRLIVHERRDWAHDFYDAWLFYSNAAAEELPLPTQEVIQAKWVNMEEFRRLHDAGEIVKTLGYMDAIFSAAREELEIKA